ncbi:MAG: hypothetical protein U1F20_01285 [Lysobacterales bacterium]
MQAIVARNAAERRQKQAEDLVDFMLGDLDDKLTKVSRLDLLSAVNDKAMAYFPVPAQRRPAADRGARTKAKALMQAGDVHLEQGQFPQALERFEAAASIRVGWLPPRRAISRNARSSSPTHSPSSAWRAGTGRLDGAQRGFDAAQTVLIARDRFNPTIRMSCSSSRSWTTTTGT